MSTNDSTGFIERNRTPRVQISYDVETGKGLKKVEIPFVIGVMAGLSGKPKEDLPTLDDERRSFEEVTAMTFDKFLAGVKPRVEFGVKNVLGGEEGSLPIDLTFQSLKDFSPERVAENVESLAKLLEARRQLQTLKTVTDGKSDVERLLSQYINDPTLRDSIQRQAEPQ